MNKKPTEAILLGIDYGDSNIGLAFGRNGLVSPLRTISGKNKETVINELGRIIIENKITELVLGLPLDYEGRETPQAQKIRRFAKLLRIKLKKPVHFVDEYASTRDSIKPMLALGVPKKRRRTNDHFSAAIILKDFFSSQAF